MVSVNLWSVRKYQMTCFEYVIISRHMQYQVTVNRLEKGDLDFFLDLRVGVGGYSHWRQYSYHMTRTVMPGGFSQHVEWHAYPTIKHSMNFTDPSENLDIGHYQGSQRFPRIKFHDFSMILGHQLPCNCPFSPSLVKISHEMVNFESICVTCIANL